jgi:hypothetical protein
MGDGTEPIEDDELLYRRIPQQLPYYDPSEGSKPGPKAFRPRKDDKTGISVFRAKYTTPKQVAMDGCSERYYVAVLCAGDIRANGLDVIPNVSGHAPGHAELPNLTYENRRTDVAEEIQILLAHKLCREVLGPLP